MFFSLKNKLKYYKALRKAYGFKSNLFLINSKFKKNKTENIKLSGIASYITLSNFTNDVSTLFKIFFGKEYDITLKNTPKVIIDCGANIGLSAVFYANKYPHALIIAIEPDETNFKFLEINTSFYKNVKCIKNAVWSHSTKMSLIDEGTGNWGLKTVEGLIQGAICIDAVSLDDVIKNFNISKIDILKIDIEGAEKELFSKNYAHWLSLTCVIAIELHDRDDKSIADVFYTAINTLSHKVYLKGENVICEFSDFSPNNL